MPTETLINLKVSPPVRDVLRQIADVTGEKMYRVLLRVLTAEWQRVKEDRTRRQKGRSS